MRLLVPVDDAKRVLAARGEQEIVPAAGIGRDAQEDVAAVAVEGVACRQEDAGGVVEGAAGGDDFANVVKIVGEEVGYLAA